MKRVPVSVGYGARVSARPCRGWWSPLLAAAAAVLMSACVGSREETSARAVAAPAAAASIPREQIIGRWGIASFHEDKDRKRTEVQAREQCRQPYVVTKGPTDGVMMHVADDAQLHELKLKGGPGGRTYLGFEAPAGHREDREILSHSDKLLVLRFVDPEVHRRYGTFVWMRCA